MNEPIVHLNVFSLNTAGSNLIFLSSSTEKEASMWAGAIRLAAWERSRLEEIQSAHLIRSQLTDIGLSFHLDLSGVLDDTLEI